MKISPIPNIDLARISVLPVDEQRIRLEKLGLGYPPHSYGPMRSKLPDILNEQYGLLPTVDRTPWEIIDSELRRVSRHEDEYSYNRAVAKALFDEGIRRSLYSRKKSIPNWSVGFGQSVSYWWDLYTVIDEQAIFPFVDPRISQPLTREARRFVLSVMHHRIRIPDPDHAESELVVIQLPKNDDGSRTVRFFSSAEVDLYEMDLLNEMVDLTYKLWIEVLKSRSSARRTGTEDAGPLFNRL